MDDSKLYTIFYKVRLKVFISWPCVRKGSFIANKPFLDLTSCTLAIEQCKMTLCASNNSKCTCAGFCKFYFSHLLKIERVIS